MSRHNNYLSSYACQDEQAIRLQIEETDFRSPFFRDIDRILYSYGYMRYADKTQVFAGEDNDHITRRMYHVQMVSKIARTIGRALGLNEDLIEAASLGHDLGHVPFGHFGETILNEISLKYQEGYFHHNIESVRLLMNLEHQGKGLNLTIQVLDAIMCHNGEFALGEYHPKNKTKEMFLEELAESYQKESLNTMVPMTLEGCVVRISDIIAYLGRDISDACSLGVFTKEEIPKEIKEVLGTHNKEIINTIVTDLINNSLDKPYLKLSSNVYDAIKALKQFNYNKIYSKSLSKEEQLTIKTAFYTVYEQCLKDLQNQDETSPIYQYFYLYKDDFYRQNTSLPRVALDYVAGMTDKFLMTSYKKIKNNHNREEVEK